MVRPTSGSHEEPQVREAWVISDLHLGQGAGSALEHFRDDDLFGAWLAARTRPEAVLVINGDFIDFLRIDHEPAPAPPVPPSLLWDEATSVDKLHLALEGHATVFDALRTFFEAGAELLFTIGNHDLDLWWPSVQSELRQRLGDKGGAIQFGLAHLLFDRVHVEHGHRFTGENRPKDFERFVRTQRRNGRDVEFLECVWGSRFVLDALNPLQSTYPYLDKVKPTWKLALHMLADSQWLRDGRSRTLVDLMRFFRRTGVPMSDVVDALLDEPDEWDLFNVDRVFGEDEVEWRRVVREIRDNEPEALAAALEAMPVDERTGPLTGPSIELGEPVELDAQASDDLLHGGRDPDAAAESELGLVRKSREVRGALDCLGISDMTHVVLGHTHDVIDGGLGGRLFNPGSWIEHLNTRDPAVKAKKEDLRSLVSNPAFYATDPRAVHVLFDGNQVRVKLEEAWP
jgi:UDP-2,3-diacylglucosamine pyrophosphatase LpxH